MLRLLVLVSIGGVVFRTNGCLAVKANEAFYSSHPYDCTKFFIQINGIQYELQCQTSLYFNEKLQMCSQDDAECTRALIKPSNKEEVNRNGNNLIYKTSKLSNKNHKRFGNLKYYEDFLDYPWYGGGNDYDDYGGGYGGGYYDRIDDDVINHEQPVFQPLKKIALKKVHSMSAGHSLSDGNSESVEFENVDSSGSSDTGSMLPDRVQSLESGLSPDSFPRPEQASKPFDTGMSNEDDTDWYPEMLESSKTAKRSSLPTNQRPNKFFFGLGNLGTEIAHGVGSLFGGSGKQKDGDGGNSGTQGSSSPDSNQKPSDSLENTQPSDLNTSGNGMLQDSLESVEQSLSHGLGSLNLPPKHDSPEDVDSVYSSEESAQLLACPLFNGDQTFYLVYPGNCSKFYNCSNGVPQVYDCPPNLQFNPIVGICDDPQNAGCIAENPGMMNANHSMYPTHMNSAESHEMYHQGEEVNENADNGSNEYAEGDVHHSGSTQEDANYESMDADSMQSSSGENEDSNENSKSNENNSRSSEQNYSSNSSGGSSDKDASHSSSSSSEEHRHDEHQRSNPTPLIEEWRHILVPLTSEWSHDIKEASKAVHKISKFIPNIPIFGPVRKRK